MTLTPRCLIRRFCGLVALCAALLAYPVPAGQAEASSPRIVRSEAPHVGVQATASCRRRAQGLVPFTRFYRSAPRTVRREIGSFYEICFDFTGDGRRDVAFAIVSGGSGGAFSWTLFRRTTSKSRRTLRRFRRLTEQGRSSRTSLRREGNLLVVSNPIYRREDANCCPTGGVIERRYRFTRRRAIRVSTRRLPPSTT
jgi:hypothetical protein